MRLRYLLPALLTFATSCAAAEKTRTVTLTTEQAVALHCVLAPGKGQDRQPTCLNIEAYEDVIKDGANERMVQRRYVYKPGVSSGMAKNILALRYVTERFDRERALLQEKIFSGGQPDEKKPAEIIEYQKQVRELLDTKNDFNLFTISDAELDQKAPYPAAVLAILDPIRE